MGEDVYFTVDRAIGAIQSTTDDNGDDISWGDQTTVKIDNPPWQRAFDTDTFHKFRVTAARPIEQTYHIDGDEYTFKKPTEELKESGWQLDNAPFTLGHPDGGIVQNTDDVHGFYRDPEYVEHDDSVGEQTIDLYVPTNDSQAQAWIEDHQSVSVGFFNRLDWDTDEDDVDAYQRDLRYDHVAGVKQGRCSEEDGCRIHADGSGTELDSGLRGCRIHADAVTSVTDGAGIDFSNNGGCSPGQCSCGNHETWEDAQSTSTTKRMADAPDGLYVDDEGNWYGISPSENSDGDPKYELNNCNDVKDAYNLRNNGDYSIETSTLVERIKRAAEAHDCPPENKPWMDSARDTMTDDDTTFSLNVDDLSVDAIADRHEGVAELQTTVDELREQKAVLEDEIESKNEQIKSLEDSIDQKVEQRIQRQELVDEITDLTDKWDVDELVDPEDGPSLDRLEERRDLLVDVQSSPTTVGEAETTTDSSSAKTGGSESTTGRELAGGVMDLSETSTVR